MEMALVQTIDAEPADRELVRMARDGDSHAFSKLVERYMRRAYYVALGLVGRHEDALDLSQEAFARAYKARHRLDPNGSFYAWLYQIIRRLCFNFNRDRKLHREKLRQAEDWLVEQHTRVSSANPAKSAERTEDIRRVRDAMERLPDRDREILVLKEFEGLKYREIAELLGIPIGTVMSRLYSARKRLAAVLEEER
jgi:RNA polymerase sigma-70 factor (ECF subfamily)